MSSDVSALRTRCASMTDAMPDLVEPMRRITGARTAAELETVLLGVFAATTAGIGAGSSALRDKAPLRDRAVSREAALDFWRTHLDAAAAPLALPTDRARQDSHGRAATATAAVPLPRATVDAVRALSRTASMPVPAALLAAFAVLLARLSGQDDVAVGVLMPRGHLVPVRVFVASDAPCGDVCRDVTRALGRAVRHAAPVTLPEILAACGGGPAAPGREPYAQAQFSWGGGGGRRHTAADFCLHASSSANGDIAAELQYDAALFLPETAARVAERFAVLLQGIATDYRTPVSRAPLLTADERRWLLEDRARAVVDEPLSSACIHERFLEQALLTPDAVAAELDDDAWTYAQLRQRATGIAAALQARGVAPDVLVAFCVERSLDMLAGLLGIMMAGGGYVAVDPTFPEDRVAYMVQDSGAPVLLTSRELVGRVPTVDGCVVLLLEDVESTPEIMHGFLVAEMTPDNLCYLLYTSGSTGRPKGVELTHRGVLTTVDWTLREYAVTPEDRFMASTTFTLDGSVLQMFCPLMVGARTVITRPKALYDLGYLAHTLESKQITYCVFVPSIVSLYLEFHTFPPCVKSVILAGEAFTMELAQRFFAEHSEQATRIVNEYGPTEACITSTWHVCSTDPATAGATQPIGRPIGNHTSYVVDDELQLVPVGVAGELLMGGAGLARGYRNRPELTAEKFVPNPWGEGRLYRTGDLVRWRADGTMEFLGRADHMVKLHGLRIELDEIEAVVSSTSGVRDAVVMVREDKPGKKLVVAYVTPEVVDEEAILALCRTRLTPYMVPSAIVALAEWPRLPNGKLNRRALPPPVMADTDDRDPGDDEGTDDLDPTELAVAKIWAALLHAPVQRRAADFFALGGNSLLAIAAAARIGDALGVSLSAATLFEHTTLGALAGAAATAPRRSAPLPLPRSQSVEGHATGQLSASQLQMLVLQSMDPASTAYNSADCVAVSGARAAAVLARLPAALCAVLARHEVLRSTYSFVGSRPVARVLPVSQAAVLLRVTTVHCDSRAQAERQLASAAAEPFDLAEELPIRVFVAEVRGDFLVLVSQHHIVTDGESAVLLWRALAAELAGVGEAEPSLQYSQYAAWEASQQQSASVDWWRGVLAGPLPEMDMHTDFRRSGSTSGAGGTAGVVRFAVPPELAERVRRVSREHRTTPFASLLAAFFAFLARHCGQDDIIVGSPVSRRAADPGLGSLLGCLVNTVALRVLVDVDAPFGTLLEQTRSAFAAALGHADAPFADVVRAAGASGQSPLYRAMFAWEELDLWASGFSLAPGVDVETVPLPPRCAKFDLMLTMGDAPGGGLVGELQYDAALFLPETAERLAGSYQALLAGAVSPAIAVKRLPLLTADERQWLLEDRARAVVDEPLSSACIHERFLEQAARTPDAVAAELDDDAWTYAQLRQRATEIAAALQARGVAPDVLVAFCVERSLDMLAGLLGIMMAGGGYVAVDPTFPEDRVAYMVQDSGAPVLLTSRELVGRVPTVDGCVVLLLEDISCGSDGFLVAEMSPDNLCYLLYTSGSTGRPKGVELTHRGVLTTIDWTLREYAVTVEDRFMASTTFTLDGSVLQMFCPLMVGARTVITRPKALYDLGYLAHTLESKQITYCVFVPSIVSLYLEFHTFPPCVKSVILAGEAFTMELAQRFFAAHSEQPTRIVNEYGPTEACITSTWHVCSTDPATAGATQPIGRPIGNHTSYVVDDELQLVPVGVAGELLMGGAGLARGYRNRPELTAEKFVPNPWGEGRLYRTGDLVRWRADGTMEFLGRADHMVKLHGLRIELDEIEAVVSSTSGVRDAVVMVREDKPGKKLVVAYVTPEVVDEEAILALCRTRLTPYMVPSAIVALAEWPRLPNGKLNRRALPPPVMADADTDDSGPGTEDEYEPPQTPDEAALAEIWAAVLQTPAAVSVTAAFFELGGNSLQAVRIVALAAERGLPQVTVASILTHRSVRGVLSASLAETASLDDATNLVVQMAGGAGRPLVLVHGAAGTVWDFGALARGYGGPVLAIQAKPAAMDDTVSIPALARRYLAALELYGEYDLAGYSFGVRVVFEMALQLEAAGRPLARLAILDAEPRIRGGDPRAPLRIAAEHMAHSLLSRQRAEDVMIMLEDDMLTMDAACAFLSAECDLGEDELEAMLCNFSAHARADLQYRPARAVEAHVLLVAGLESWGERDPDQCLKPWAPSRRVVRVPGNHFTFLHSANVGATRDALREFFAG